jgi:hypothetical protein
MQAMVCQTVLQSMHLQAAKKKHPAIRMSKLVAEAKASVLG